MKLRDKAICLRAIDYSETSQVVHFFSRESGVVKLLAKGTKRPKSKSAGAIDVMDEGDLVFITKSSQALGTMAEFTPSVSRRILRSNPQRIYAGLYMVEMAELLLAEADPHPETFDLLHNALARLNSEDAPWRAVLAFFQWRILIRVGLMGPLDCCVACGVKRKTGPDIVLKGCFFSSTNGGLICRSCSHITHEKIPVDPETLQGFDALMQSQTQKPQLTEKQIKSINKILAYHTSYQTGRKMKLAKYVLR